MICKLLHISILTFKKLFLKPGCRIVLEKCYICTVLPLMRSKTISVGGLTRCPGHTQYIKLLVVMGGLYLSHNFYNITKTSLFLCIRAENYTVTLIMLG